jgi:plastocyanin
MRQTTPVLVMLCCLTPLLLGAKRVSIAIDKMQFSPSSVEVQVGDTVTWTNGDDRDHTVVGDSFRSGNLRPGASYSYQFNKAGKFNYGSSIYPRMKGSITVKEK